MNGSPLYSDSLLVGIPDASVLRRGPNTKTGIATGALTEPLVVTVPVTENV